jgi:hypothetical protein
MPLRLQPLGLRAVRLSTGAWVCVLTGASAQGDGEALPRRVRMREHTVAGRSVQRSVLDAHATALATALS